MKKWGYIFGLIFFWLIFSTGSILFLFRFILTYGKVEVRIDYTAFKKENITLYYDDHKGWSSENYITKTARNGRKIYTYYIRQTDTIKMLRVDPDENCDSAILHSVEVNGMICPLFFNDFAKNDHNGSRVIQTKDGAKIYRDTNNNDPYLIIPIPVSCEQVIYKMKIKEIIYIAIILLLDMVFLLITIKQKFIWRFFMKHGLLKGLLVSIFLICISMYWANRVFEVYPDQPNIENRQLQKFPDLKLVANNPDSLFKCISQWCNDNFMYRNILIGTRSAAYISLFKQSSIPERVVIGKKLMFFASIDALINDFEGRMKYSQKQINEICSYTKDKHDILARNGIRFLLVMPPSKQTVYNDLMPDYYKCLEKKPSLLDEVVENMSKYRVNYFISLADTLINLRQRFSEKQLFFNTDTHWNEYGAFKAYQSVMNILYNLDTSYGKPLCEKDVSIDTLTDNQGDLAQCLIVNDIYKRVIYRIKPKVKDFISEKQISENNRNPILIYTNPKGHGKVLFYRDSYTIQWAPFFAHNFNQCILIWDHHIDLQEILRYKPDIVIEEVGEFYLDHLLIPIK